MLCAIALPLASQIPGQIPGQSRGEQEMVIRQMLRNRDVNEAELRTRLEARGIQTEGISAEEALRLKPQIEEVIATMESEKAQATQVANEVASRSTIRIEEAVAEGSTSVEEAISEVTTEAATEILAVSNIYGHQLFRDKSLQVYRATENVTPPDSYPLKPGDELAVSIFGASQTDLNLRIDNRGSTKLPNGVAISLGGIPLSDARILLASRLKQYYTFRDGELSIRIQAARTISVNIFGDVENNGSFSLSSINTGFNAMVAAGGPTDRGTVRNIQLIDGDETTILDVYEYLRNPTEKSGLFLSNNASIFVPPAEKIVALRGGVDRPMRYELKAGETLIDLIDFAGGTKTRAEVNNIQVTRYVDGALELFNVDLDATPNFNLEDEDFINVPIIEDPIQNFVTIEGAVLLPGRYPFETGITLDTLLKLGRLRPGARTDVAFLFRDNDDGTQRLDRIDLDADATAKNIILKRGDRLQVLAQSAYVDNATFSVSGAVRGGVTTLPFPQDGALTLEEAVLLAGGTETNAIPEVMLIRTPLTNSKEKIYERIDLLTDGSYALEPFDRIVVYFRERFTDEATVSISGAVRGGGTYTYDPSLTLRDLIYMGGGTRIDAAPDRVEVFRLQISEGGGTKTLLTTIDLNADEPFTLQAYDEVIVRSAAEFETIQNIVIKGEVRYPGTYALLKDNERLFDVIIRAGGLTGEAFPEGARLYRESRDTGFVVLDLDEVIVDPANPANVVLIAGDILSVPKKEDLITIYTVNTQAHRFNVDSTNVGGVLRVAYKGPYSARWYVENYAGGFDDDNARRRSTTVEYANGGVKETNSFLLFKDYPDLKPGAIVRVGAAPPKRQKQRREERFDWLRLVSILASTATTIVTFVLISQRNTP